MMNMESIRNKAKAQSFVFAAVLTSVLFAQSYGILPVVAFVVVTTMFGAVCFLLAE